MGWLRWPWALLGIGLLTMAFIESTRLAFRHSRSTGYSPDFSPRFTWRHVIILLLTSTTWLSLSGAGGIGYQRGDWMKHESVLKDLIEHTWPVIYDFYQTPVPLVYYLAFYLPAALAGKIGGWSMGQAAIFLWAFLGVNLAMLWFWVLVRKSSYWILLLFVLLRTRPGR